MLFVWVPRTCGLENAPPNMNTKGLTQFLLETSKKASYLLSLVCPYQNFEISETVTQYILHF